MRKKDTDEQGEKKKQSDSAAAVDARAKGHAAMLAGKSRTSCTLTDYPYRGVQKAWLEGWDAAAREKHADDVRARAELHAHYPEPKIQTKGVEVTTPGGGAPVVEFPTSYLTIDYPCPKCGETRLPKELGGGKAVLCKNRTGGKAYLACRAPGCGHSYELGVVDARKLIDELRRRSSR